MKIKTFFYGADWRSQIVLEKIKNNQYIELVDKWQKAELGVLASYGKILTRQELAHFCFGIVNVHPSLLPKYRGGKPVTATLLRGDDITGVTLIKLVEQVDAGPIVGQIKEKVLATDTTESLEKRLFELGGKLLDELLADYVSGKITLQAQNESQATWAPLLKKADGEVTWTKPAAYLERFIRAMSPWPGAFTQIRVGASPTPTKYLKILKGHLEKGKLVLDLVQLAGKKPVTFAQFWAGYPQLHLFWRAKKPLLLPANT